jgi:hypothetical protein
MKSTIAYFALAIIAVFASHHGVADASLADCSVGDYKKLVCEAITGPNGGDGACKFSLNRFKTATYKRCINNRNFVDTVGEATVTTTKTTTSTQLSNACPLGVNGYDKDPKKRQVDNTFRYGRKVAITVRMCARLCSSEVKCLAFSYNFVGRYCDRLSEIPPTLELKRHRNSDVYTRRSTCP